MAAAAEPSGHLIATTIYPGQTADDPLYVPMTRRVRTLLGRAGLLYVGDCKMAALGTRAELASHGDYYLMPLPQTGGTKKHFEQWLSEALGEPATILELWNGDEFLGQGREFTRIQQSEVDGKEVTWTERVQLLRSPTLTQQQHAKLEKRLGDAERAIYALTPPVGPGKKQCRDEVELQAQITAILERYDVVGLLVVHSQREEQTQTKYDGPGRGGSNRVPRTHVQVRYQITEVRRVREAIEACQKRLGWRVQVTNAPMERMSLEASVLSYRSGWCLERDFHLLKDKPLGISPLFVKLDDQIGGLTRLLTLALRLLSLVEMQVRRGVAATGGKVKGFFSGQPGRQTASPSGTQVLQTVARQQLTLLGVETPDGTVWQLKPLPTVVRQVLGFLGLPETLYTNLTQPTPAETGARLQNTAGQMAGVENSS
jgi:transposase